MLHHYFMHIDHELVEFMLVDEQEYEEVIKEYEEEILMQEGAPEPFGANLTDPSPAQGKPRCITPIFYRYIYIYIYDVHLSYIHFIKTTCINILIHESY